MQSKDAVTRFLNVDLDLCGDERDLDVVLKSVEASIIVLSHQKQFASIELAQQFDSLDETVRGIIGLVGAFQPELRDVWERLETRSLNIGIQSALEPYSLVVPISANTAGSIAALGFEIVITVYAPLKN